MLSLSGLISDKLRAKFGPDVSKWPAARQDNVKRDAQEDSYTGQTLGKRYRRSDDGRS